MTDTRIIRDRLKNTVVLSKSDRKNKKYKAVVQFKDGRIKTVHFGDSRYQQYKDSTGLGIYSKLDHNDPDRRRAYYARHGKTPTLYSAKYFSHKYLW